MGFLPLISGGHVVMLLGHLAAAALAGVWLAAGERALWMVLVLAARPVVDAWQTSRPWFAGGSARWSVSGPRLQLTGTCRARFMARMWAAGPVSRARPACYCAS